MLALSAIPAPAQDMPAALGRISYAATIPPGGAICTGALIAPDVVLTAGHCVKGAMRDPASLRFDVDWRSGQPKRQGRGAQVLMPQGPILTGLAGLAQDVALIRLKTPLDVAPLPLAATYRPKPGDGVPLFAFRRDAPARPAPVAPCRVVAHLPGFLGFDCPVASGNSGAPVLTPDGQVAGVFVAKGSDEVPAWAVELPAWVRAQLRVTVSHAKQ